MTTRTITGSSGARYTVQLDRVIKKCTCDCLHYRYRRPVDGCKHIKAARKNKRKVTA